MEYEVIHIKVDNEDFKFIREDVAPVVLGTATGLLTQIPKILKFFQGSKLGSGAAIPWNRPRKRVRLHHWAPYVNDSQLEEMRYCQMLWIDHY